MYNTYPVMLYIMQYIPGIASKYYPHMGISSLNMI